MGDLKLTAEQREFRDDAALAALSGLLANEQLYRQVSMMDLPARAYQLADAMLAARSKP